MLERMRVYAAKEWQLDAISIKVLHRFPDGSKAILTGLTWTKFDPDTLVLPTAAEILMSATDAQELMDELWGCGVRPTEGNGNTGALAATERHLSDMQTINARLLDAVLKPNA